MKEKQIFEVRYVDDCNSESVAKAMGRPVLIEAFSIVEAFNEARFRAQQRVAYSVGSVVRIA